ncbi:MAG: sodium/proline symporter PutP [Treponema sp.]|nr:sodium/proline symporter PutP [Treponema sp.]
MSEALIARLVAFVLYLAFMIYIGLRYMKKNNSSEDFFLGGRKVGPWMTALSAEASDMSGWLLMGLPGVAYLTGLKEAFWTAIGLEIGTYLNWFFVAKRLRRYTESCGNSITIPEFLTNRFKDKSHTISFISVIFILIFFTIYTASGFVACGKLINSVFGVPYIISVLIGMAVILAYTMAGGFLAVCATDFIQGTLMFVALIITTVIMIAVLGGPAAANAKVALFGAQFLNPFVDDGTGFGIMSIISALGWGLGYFGMPHILVRFMGVTSDKDIPLSRRIAMIWVTIAFIGALMIGAFAKAYLNQPLAAGAQETVIIETIKQMYPAFIGGIFLCAILAAAMSTADSQLLVAASAFSEDFVSTILKRNLSQKQMVIISRLTVLAIALIAFLMSMNEHSTIFKLVSYAWAGFGATFGPLILLALFWRGTTNKGAIAGIIAGGITVIVWHNLNGGIFNMYEIIPGFIMCLLFAVIFSIMDKNKNVEMLAEFDAYKAGLKQQA